jgi:hypothetical protein
VKYLALIYADERRWDALPESERAAMEDRYRAFADEAGGAGKLAGGSELAPTSAATTVRVRSDETIVSDGPFAETKEALGGYFVLDCDSLEEAVALAARIPGAAHGGVEVRPAYVEAAT